jgi:hypothetical protein
MKRCLTLSNEFFDSYSAYGSSFLTTFVQAQRLGTHSCSSWWISSILLQINESLKCKVHICPFKSVSSRFVVNYTSGHIRNSSVVSMRGFKHRHSNGSNGAIWNIILFFLSLGYYWRSSNRRRSSRKFFFLSRFPSVSSFHGFFRFLWESSLCGPSSSTVVQRSIELPLCACCFTSENSEFG